MLKKTITGTFPIKEDVKGQQNVELTIDSDFLNLLIMQFPGIETKFIFTVSDDENNTATGEVIIVSDPNQ